MPLALLLQETVYTLRWGAFHLEPWTHLVRTEALLIDRARGAFLTRWFGSGLPLKGALVNIVIANLQALRDQYFRARQSLLPEPEGPNLAEPLAGLAGEVVGIVLSPSTALLVSTVILRKLRVSFRTLVGELGWGVALLPVAALLVPAVGPIVLGVAAIVLPFAAFWPVALGATSPAPTRELYDVLGAAARLLIEATKFLKLLLGPRERIANPLLRAILELFDQLAGLVPFLLAFVAFVVVRISPLIEPLARQVAPFRALIDETLATVSFIFADIFGDGPNTITRYMPLVADRLDFVLVQLGNIFPVLTIAFTEMFTDLGEALGRIVDKATVTIKDWLKDAKETGTAIIKAQPLMLFLEQAKPVLTLSARLLAPGPSTPPSPPDAGKTGMFDKFISDFPRLELTRPAARLAASGGPPPGGLGAIATLAGIDIKHAGALFEDYLPFSKGARAGLEAVEPTHVFGAEHGALVRQLGQEPAKALAALRLDQLRLREALGGMLARVLPASLQTEVTKLLGHFQKLDAFLFEARAAKPDHPVRDLPDNGRLRPVVRRLVIRGTDLARADADAFQQRLLEAMNALAYPAVRPAEGLVTPGR